MTEDLFSYLRGIDYPGRGIVIGRTPCGKRMRIGYFIMGRSSNSRNRVFVTDGDGIRTQAFDPSKMEDPSLIIYAPVRVFRDQTIVTNGDQTDTIYQALEEGVKGSSYRMSILKSDEGNPASTLRQFFDYSEEQPGFGRIIHTYAHNGSPIPSFRGEPVRWEMVHEPFDQFSQHLWEALNPDNKVSLFTRQITIETGETETKIFNRNEEEK